MRLIKWVAAVVSVLFVVVVMTAYVVVSGYDINKLKPEISEAVLEATGRELVIAGDMDIKFGLSPVLTASDIKFQNAEWSNDPYMATIDAIELKLRLLPLIFKSIEVKRFIVTNPEIFVETDSKGRSNLAFTPPETNKSAQEKVEIASSDDDGAITTIPDISLDDLRIEGGRFTFKDGQTKREYAVELKTLKAVLPAVAPAVVPEADESMTLTLDGKYKGKPFALDGSFGALAGLLSKDVDWPVKVQASFDTIKVNLDGTARDILGERIVDMDFVVRGKDLADMEILTGNEVPLHGPFEFKGRAVAPKAHTYKLTDFTANLGGSDLSGIVTAEVARSGGRPPRLTAKLRSDKLDLRAILKKSERPNTAGAEAPAIKKKRRKKRVFSKAPLDFKLLSLVDGDIDLKAKQVLLEKLAFTELSVGINLSNGKMKITPLKGEVGGGAVTGSLMVDASNKKGASKPTPEVVVKFKGDNIDVGRMLGDLGVTDSYKGKIDVDIDVSGSGRSIAEIMAKLNGRAYLSAGKGRIKSRYAAIIDGDILSAILRSNGRGEEVELAGSDEVVKVNCLVLGFKASEGVAKTTAFLFDTRKASVQGKGRVKLYNEHIELTFDLVQKDSLNAGGVGIGLSQLIKPLKIKGTLARPKVKVDSGKAAITLLKGLGGAAILGPPGALLALTGSRHEEGKNACVAAIEKAKTTGKKKPTPASTTTKPAPEPVKDIEDLGKEFERGLKNLLGR